MQRLGLWKLLIKKKKKKVSRNQELFAFCNSIKAKMLSTFLVSKYMSSKLMVIREGSVILGEAPVSLNLSGGCSILY